ncbi:MAG TPA: hypothetical protein VHK91_07580 [Flavisolibacter sp.]|jgi:hypothetical protein|nr:hypothetical protein [Flavisolibacter sp.]
MHSNVWAKYLPIIRILLKKAITSEQQLNLNIPDFERVGLTRKTGYKFLIRFKSAKVDNVIIDSPVASSLASSLLEDQSIKAILLQEDFSISMNAKFQMTITHIPGEVHETEASSSQSSI